MDARCPHLGADLGQGAVVDDRIRCAFHHWAYDASGQCVEAPGLRATPRRCGRVYKVAERYGLIWLFHGARPVIDLPPLPGGDDPRRYWLIAPPSRRIACHPHLVIANGLDVAHFQSLHNMVSTAEPTIEQTGAYELTLTIQGRPKSRALRWLTGTRRVDVVARFINVGASIAWVSLETPVRFHVLFTARPWVDRGCETQVVLFVPKRVRLGYLRAMCLVYKLLYEDHQVLHGLAFRPGFTEADAPLQRFAQMVDSLATG